MQPARMGDQLRAHGVAAQVGEDWRYIQCNGCGVPFEVGEKVLSTSVGGQAPNLCASCTKGWFGVRPETLAGAPPGTPLAQLAPR